MDSVLDMSDGSKWWDRDGGLSWGGGVGAASSSSSEEPEFRADKLMGIELT